MPRPWLVRVLLAWLVLHFSLIALSYTSSIAASSVQVRILDAFHPYLAITHLDADGTPLLFSDSTSSEKMHLLSEASSVKPETEDDWITVGQSDTESSLMGGIAGGDRQRRWQRFLATLAELGEKEQGALIAWFMEPIAMSRTQAQQLRITREPDLMTTVVDDDAPPPYTVAIVRQDGKGPRLVQAAPKRLASPAIQSSGAGNP